MPGICKSRRILITMILIPLYGIPVLVEPVFKPYDSSLFFMGPWHQLSQNLLKCLSLIADSC